MKNLIKQTADKVIKVGGNMGKFIGSNPEIIGNSMKLIYEVQKGRNYRENLRTYIEVESYHTQIQINKAKQIDEFLTKHKKELDKDDISKLVDIFCKQF